MSEKRLFFLLDKAHHRFFSDMERLVLQHFGIPLAQLIGLFALKPKESILMKQFGQRMGLKNAGVTGLINRMLKAGLVERNPSETDARAALIGLSLKGANIRKQAQPLMIKLNALLSSEFSEQEMAAVVRFLNFLSQRDYLDTLHDISNTIEPVEGHL